jgi:alkaline phosphatase D
MNRRETLTGIAGLALGSRLRGAGGEPPHGAAGERVGEVTATSAIVHARLTAAPTRNNRGYSFPVHTHNLSTMNQLRLLRMPDKMPVSELEGSCAGRAGRARLRYGVDPKLAGAAVTPWVEVGPKTDFTHQFALRGLQPGAAYYYSLETSQAAGGDARQGAPGSFKTAPERNDWRPVRFFVLSCQDYGCRDDIDGFRAYRSMNRLGADFTASVGDNVYYDLDLPFATTVDIARFHWQRMYSQPLVMDLFRNMSGYWLKDDHDSFEDDDWPARPPQRVAPMTYKDLSPVFTEQIPMGESTYRRVRWGKGLEIWFTESRDFRSPNSAPDGPAKTIWGAKQKAWLERTLLESDADFRVLISPNCIVGPDASHGTVFKYPGGGADSHGDNGFGYEGREFRKWVHDKKLTNFITINGDRHWQYHSVDPETGVREFSCGAVTDSHSVKSEKYDAKYHRFLRTKGGFVSVSLDGTRQDPRLTVRFHDVEGKTVFESQIERS